MSGFLIKGGSIPCRIFLSLGIPAILFLIPVTPAQASTGNEYVFGADSPITTTNPGTQSFPAVSGSNAIWSDYRQVSQWVWRYRILIKDLTPSLPGQAAREEQVLVEDSYGVGSPDIDGSLVVWKKHAYVSGVNGYQIQYMYVGGGCPGAAGCGGILPSYFGNASSPRVSGSRIIWIDTAIGTNDIHMYDLDAGMESVIAAGPYNQAPAIDGDWVVWVKNGDYYLGAPRINDLYARNVVTGEIRQLTSDGRDGQQEAPAISGTKIVWDVNGSHNHGLFIYDLSTGQTQAVPGSDYAENARIERNIIVWNRYYPSRQIFLHDLSTGITQQVSNGTGAYISHPDLSRGHLVWEDDRNGSRAIFQNNVGNTEWTLAEKYKPELHFRHDMNQNYRNDFEPRTVDLMVDAAEKLHVPGGDIFRPSLQDLIDNPGPDSYLDLSGSPANPFHEYIEKYLAQIDENPQKYRCTSYARVVPKAEGTDKTVIQYWLNYYYNNWHNNHEGDWEMVEVILDESMEPEAAAYSQHGAAFKKNWNEFGFSKTGTHPSVFVAEGSHANYFFEASALHFLDAATAWALQDSTGSSSSSMPDLDMQDLAEGWGDFAGLWGQKKSPWCIWCDDGPVGPAFQPGDPWNRPLAWASSNPMKGYLNDWIIAAHSPVELHLFDSMGNHVGKNASGGIDMQIPGSEYFERTEDHSKNIVVHNSDVLSNYFLKIEGTGTGTMDLEIQVPDFGGNVVDRAQYMAVDVNPSMKAEFNVTSVKDFDLQVDSNGDGIFEQERPPDANETIGADFTPPAAVTDLSVAETTSGSATLIWTSTGDDGAGGTALGYDLRYSTEPITEENWPYAKSAASPLQPKTAGTQETATVTGLGAGTVYYFALRARDDSWQESDISNAATGSTKVPILAWAIQRIYWANWVDYQNRHLSIDYQMSSVGTGVALESTVEASLCTPDTVHTVTSLPLAVADIDPSAYSTVTLRYYVPTNVGSFKITTYATCKDYEDRMYWFPGLLSQN